MELLKSEAAIVWLELIFGEPHIFLWEMSSLKASGPRDFLGESLKSVFLRFWTQVWRAHYSAFIGC